MNAEDIENANFFTTKHMKGRQKVLFAVAILVSLGAGIYCSVMAAVEAAERAGFLALALAFLSLTIAIAAHVDSSISNTQNYQRLMEKLEGVSNSSVETTPVHSCAGTSQAFQEECLDIRTEDKGLYVRLGSRARWFKKSK